MADGRQPEDGASQWATPGTQDSSSPVGENGFPYRTCQPGAAHAATAASYAKENGFNGDLPSGHEVTAGRSLKHVLELKQQLVYMLNPFFKMVQWMGKSS